MIIINEFIEKFKEQFLDPEETVFTEDTKFRELADWDSLTGMSILVMIEDEYKITVTPDEFKNCERVSDIISFINKKVSE
jgi:acyl carrier protein